MVAPLTCGYIVGSRFIMPTKKVRSFQDKALQNRLEFKAKNLIAISHNLAFRTLWQGGRAGL